MRLLIALFALLFTAAASPAFAQKTEQAVFAGGCSWCMESDMQVPGVISVESGYTGGAERHPNYKAVARQFTGHYEAVRVTYDPAKVSYDQLLTRFSTAKRRRLRCRPRLPAILCFPRFTRTTRPVR